MKPLDIIEQNLTKEEFIAYLRGSILMFLLSERPLVLSEFKLYANKLVEVVKSPLVGSAIEETKQQIRQSVKRLTGEKHSLFINREQRIYNGYYKPRCSHCII